MIAGLSALIATVTIIILDKMFPGSNGVQYVMLYLLFLISFKQE